MNKKFTNKLAVEVGVFLLLFFLVTEGVPFKNGEHLFFSVIRFLILYVCATICRYLFFIPYFLNKKYAIFCVLAILNIVVFSVVYYYYKLFFIAKFEPEFLYIFSFIDALALCIIATIIICSIEFVYKFIKMQKENNAFQQASNQVAIKQLQSQLNPHFLFNCLNNAYGLSLADSEKASEYILSLSQLMRYQIEGGKKESLLLDDDMDFMHHYIYVENERVNKRCKINFVDSITKNEKEAFCIVPLLFLPFVENAIKHGTATKDDSKIDISMSMEGNIINFVCKNTKPSNIVKVESTGTGLINVKTRLDILYGIKHKLKIENQSEHFLVTLNIELNKNEKV